MDPETKEKTNRIDDVSPSFCLAKWLQCTVDLYNGSTHSCHHPDRHAIPLEELEKDYSALHNTQFKKKQRKKMLEGERPSECEYCWKIEDLKKGHLSDRYIKSMDPWAFPHLEKISKMPWDQNIAPTYLEVMFDNVCNLSCCYCMADVSSSINNEMKKYGAYKVSDPGHRMPRGFKKSDEYVKAFWKWLPEIYQKLNYLRVTGGEPFLSPNVDQLFNYIENNEANPHLTLAINTNLILKPEELLRKIERLNQMKKDKLHSIELYTSLEASGKAAEYIRPGLEYNLFLRHLEMVGDELDAEKLVIMATYNIFSLYSFTDFCRDILSLKKKFGKEKEVVLDISYLKDPTYLRADSLSKGDHVFVEDSLMFMEDHHCENGDGFSQYEINKFKRVVDWMKAPKDPNQLTRQRADLYHFLQEYDRRKNLDHGLILSKGMGLSDLIKFSASFLD